MCSEKPYTLTMTITRIIEGEFFLIIIAAVVISSFFIWNNHKNFQPFQIKTPIIGENDQQKTAPQPTVNPQKIQIETVSQPSPDGKKLLTMKTTHNRNAILRYDFFTSDSSGANENTIYIATGSATETMKIPFNTW